MDGSIALAATASSVSVCAVNRLVAAGPHRRAIRSTAGSIIDWSASEAMNPIAPSRTFSRRFRTRSTSELISKFFLDAQYVTRPPTIVPDRLAEAVIAGMNQAELPINDLSQSAPNQ